MKKYIKIFYLIFAFIIVLNCNAKLYSQISAPELLSPLNNSLQLSLTPSLIWYETEYAISYSIQVSYYNNFVINIIDIGDITDISYAITEELDICSQLFWRVKATDGIIESPWSNIWSFVTECVPVLPYLISPINNQSAVQIPVTFDWFSDQMNNNNIQISTDTNFFTIVVDSNINDTQLNSINLNYQTTYYWRVRTISNPYYNPWSSTWSFTTEPSPSSNIEIPLSLGWNLISSNIIPEEQAMESVFEGMNNIVFVKNGAGQIFFPAFGLNQIGDWNVEAGYYVYTNSSSILNISGNEVNPVLQGIQLNPGWHLVSYLRNSPMNVQQALGSIASNLIIAKNNLGGIYHPGFGINTLGEMQPGQGYWLYISSPALLTYPEN